MPEPYVDTNVLIRLLTGDNLARQAASRRLFERVERGELTLRAPETVISDAVYVLSSPTLYGLPHELVRDLLYPLLALSRFQVDNRAALLRALDVYASTNLTFGDAVIVGSMREEGSTLVYSYDRDLGRFPDISRAEP